jgi:HD-like signal output (HDOD) protein
MNDADPMDCFIGGLLHDFGKVVFAQFMPVEFKAALQESQSNHTPLHLALQKHIGADHFVVGAMLVEKWRFAPALIETIGHQNLESLKDTEMIACVFGANQICKKLQYGFAGNPCFDEFPATVQNRLGGTLDQVIASLGDLNAVFEEAKIFAKL